MTRWLFALGASLAALWILDRARRGDRGWYLNVEAQFNPTRLAEGNGPKGDTGDDDDADGDGAGDPVRAIGYESPPEWTLVYAEDDDGAARHA